LLFKKAKNIIVLLTNNDLAMLLDLRKKKSKNASPLQAILIAVRMRPFQYCVHSSIFQV